MVLFAPYGEGQNSGVRDAMKFVIAGGFIIIFVMFKVFASKNIMRSFTNEKE